VGAGNDDDGAHTVWLPDDVSAPAPPPPGRVEDPDIAMPVLGLDLAGAALDGGERDPEAPSLDVVGRLNDAAYEQGDVLRPLFAALGDAPGLATHGIRVDGAWACVLITLRVGDDVAVHYVATDAAFRRRGLASRLIRAALTEARDADGDLGAARTATLQASPDGLSVYEKLGFHRVGLLRAYQRPRRP
jgi:GNAT superfamily N-acetyltransferase